MDSDWQNYVNFKGLLRVIRHFLVNFNKMCHTIVESNRLRILGVNVGRNVSISGRIDLNIHPFSRVYISDNVRINSGFNLNPVGGWRRTGLWVGKNGVLSIGKGVAISNSTIVCMNKIDIEDDVFIGGDCNIYDTDFHSLFYDQRIIGNHDEIKSLPILIKKHSFIGSHSVILKGITIGEGSIIGAGSVVTRDVPNNEIWAGNPIRKIREII